MILSWSTCKREFKFTDFELLVAVKYGVYLCVEVKFFVVIIVLQTMCYVSLPCNIQTEISRRKFQTRNRIYPQITMCNVCTQFCLISLVVFINKYFWVQETEKLAWFSISLKVAEINGMVTNHCHVIFNWF